MSHAPKHAMLIALEGQRLSRAGARRAQRHLDGCEVCRNAASGHRELAMLLASTRTLAAPTLGYDAMELALRREARAQGIASSRRTLVQALAVAAVLGLTVFGGAWLAWTPQRSADNPASSATPHDMGADQAGAATTTAGDRTPTQAAADTTTATGALGADEGPAITEGTWLRASTQALVVALWDGTEMVLAPGTEARVVTFRDHQLHVTLLRGSISNRVAKLGAHERYVIEVNDHWVTVRGTRFTVTKTADGTAEVALSEGKVDVTRAGVLVSRLVAPARWVEDRAAGSRDTLRATKADAPNDDSGDPHALRLAKPVRADRPGAGQVAPKAVQHLLARAAPLLRSCHEASKRAHPDLPDQVQLALAVAATGQVESVEVSAHGATLPDDLVSCLRARALTWHLALQVAGPVQVLIPLQFGAAP